MRSLLCVWVSLWFLAGSALAQQVSGETIYRERCASCHELADPRIPPRQALQKMPAARILKTLDFGAMMSIAYPLRRTEREAVAGYLGVPDRDAAPQATAFCADRSVKLDSRTNSQWNGWSPTTANTRFQSADAAGLPPDRLSRLKLKWAFGFDGDISAFAQPTILGGYLFVGSAGGVIHALSVENGCTKWLFQAEGPVRSAILAVPLGQRHALLFGDQNGWFYALEAETGRLLWKKKIEDHEAARLTAAPVAFNGNVFVPAASWEETRALNPEYPCCTFRGSVTALRIRDGSLVWKTYMIPEKSKQTGKNRVGTSMFGPSGAGIWSAPTIDAKRGRLYVTTGDNYSSPSTATSDAVVALGLANGRIAWSKQVLAADAYNSSCGTDGVSCPEEKGPDYDFGSSALMVKLSNGRDLLVAGQKSGVVYALDPDRKGEIVWQARVGKGGVNGGVQWGMASDGQNVYAAVSDVVRRRRTPTPSDPIAVDLDPQQGGGLTALHLDDGKQVWHASPVPCASRARCSPAQSAAVTALPGIVFSGSWDGHLRAFSAEDGKVVWDFDSVREYQTVNGVKANGGSMDGPGVVVVNGMLFVNSGYARNGGMPGNVLLVFGLEN
ncbi:MAG TPA: PQQ-binding-like beta-propeller repeat protein [Terriglobia bacterium]|nr:PQQ-binding-like beta-propeller repeat protein [Terriglobia bacterium]